MVTHLTGGLQLLAFTHHLIDLNIQSDVVLYQSLCAAYVALIDEKVAAGYAAIEGLVSVPSIPTAQTLGAAIEAVIKTYQN